MCRYRRFLNREGGKTGRKRSALFLLFLCLTMELSCFPIQVLGAEYSFGGAEAEIPESPRNVLYDSLEPFEELELSPEDIAEAEAESESQSSRVRKTPSARAAASEWTKYESNYYYLKLTAEEQAFWDLLDGQCAEFLNGTSDLGYSSDGSCRLKILNYHQLEGGRALTYNQATKVYQMFRYSKPQYYFLTNSTYRDKIKKADGSVDESLDEGHFQLGVFPEFARGADRTAANAKIKYQIEAMLAEINEETTPLRKEKAAHDLICEKVSYDTDYDTMAKNKFNQTIYSVLCTDTTVCAGYSQTMMLLMNASGIDCAMAISSTHAWNIVNLDAGIGQGKQWYYTDLTWDDQPFNWIYTYFNRSREAIHKIDTASHMEEAAWIPYLPETKDAPVKRTAMPAISLQNGQITLISDGADIYYTVNGDTPFQLKRAVKYTAGFEAGPGMKIAAVTSREGYFESSLLKASVCQVNFVLEGNAYGTPCLLLEGQQVSEPKMTPPAGYTFSGWCTNPECTKAYPFSGAVTDSMTLYGRWQKIPVLEEVKQEVPVPEEVKQERICQVLFDSCGGSAVASQSVREGQTIQQNIPVRAGYTFAGWYTSKDYGTPYNFSAGVTGDMVLFAKWKARTYTVTYQANGGYIGKKSVTSKKVTVTYDRKYGTQPEPKRKGYVFLGWYTKKSRGSKIEDSQIVKITGKKTYYARWSKVKPKKASFSSVKSQAAGKITVKIKKVPEASGYEIRYSLKSSMGSAKKVKVSGTEKTVSGLKKGKKYYVQVRMYQKESVSGKKTYGAWSNKRSVTVKKK